MFLRKIEKMYHYYGIGTGKCENCPHLIKKFWNKTYYKCRAYGESNAVSTDWKKSYDACGLIDKPFPDDELRVVYRVAFVKESKPLSGQLSLFEEGEMG